MSSPVKQVLDTYELLQIIIASLPPKRMFIVLAVSKSWRSIIAESNDIQRLMFRLPNGLPLEPIRVPTSPPSDCGGLVPEYDREVTFNRMGLWLLNSREKTRGPVVFVTIILEKQNDKTGLSTLPDLYLMQPPCTTAFMDIRIRYGVSKHHFKYCSLWLQEGLKTSSIIQAVNNIIDDHIGPNTIKQVHIALTLRMPLTKSFDDSWDYKQRKVLLDESETVPKAGR